MAKQNDDPLGGAEVAMMESDGRQLRVARWRCKGSTRPPLLFFNGIGANIELVAPFARQLGDRDFVIFDMPGVGGSPDPVVPYTAMTMAHTAIGIMDQFGYDSMDLMGVSWGGAMAQHFAMQYPDRVERVILAATSAGWMMVPGKLSALSKMADPRRHIDPDYMARNFAVLYGGRTDGSDGHVSRLRPPSGLGYAYQLLAMLGWTSAPFLPFAQGGHADHGGEEDNIVPVANARFLNRLIPGSELVIIPDGGHLFLVAQAAESLQHVRRFLDAPRDEKQRAA